MRVKFVVFFTLLMGLSFAIVEGASDPKSEEFEGSGLCLKPVGHDNFSGDFFSVMLEPFYNTVGAMSGSYLLKKLANLVREHPMKSMALAVVIGIITNENKANIIGGIRNLRNSAYRVMGFGLKTNEEGEKDGQRKEIKFVEWVDSDDGTAPNSDKLFVLDA